VRGGFQVPATYEATLPTQLLQERDWAGAAQCLGFIAPSLLIRARTPLWGEFLATKVKWIGRPL
jgi:hypothetical protein